MVIDDNGYTASNSVILTIPETIIPETITIVEPTTITSTETITDAETDTETSVESTESFGLIALALGLLGLLVLRKNNNN